MIRIVSALSLSLMAGVVAASAGGGVLYPFEADTSNKASVQRGAKNFMNYCSGCHSLGLLRYNRFAADNDVPDDLLGEIMFTSTKPGEHIVSAIPEEASAKWFGRTPPDLTLTARARGSDWIYSFLKSFYLDDSKATGVNNLQLPGAAMPHVLGGLQGYQALGHDDHDEASSGGHGPAKPNFEMAHTGTLDEAGYDKLVADLVNFLEYAAEPGKAKL
ncbi:MAG: cytochrome c1, partial [Oceanococcus sp.]